MALRSGVPDGVAVAEAREGPFHLTIVEAGTLQALRSVTYASAIQSNQAKIVAIVPEGKMVAKGDLLLLFDAAPFEEEIRRSQAQLAQAQAELDKAKQDYKLQAIQNQEELAAARQKVERSQLELADVQGGKGLVREEEAVAAVSNAERELAKASGAYEDLKPLLEQGFITKQELDRADQAVARAREDLSLAKRRRDSLVELRPAAGAVAGQGRRVAHPGERAAARGLGRLPHGAASAPRSPPRRAGSRRRPASWPWPSSSSRAPRCGPTCPGIVVYRDVFFGSEQRKPQVGDQVWANQPLLILPDISRMVVETKVRETDIHKIERNQKVAVRVQAYPDLKLTGKVTLVGTLAQEEKERRGDEVLRRHRAARGHRAAAPARDERDGGDRGRGAAARPLRAAGGRVREGRAARLLRRPARPAARARGGGRVRPTATSS